MTMIKMTQDLMQSGKSINGGWNSKQLKALGETQTNGWYSRIVGREFSKEAIDEFLQYKNDHFKNKPQKVDKILLKKGLNGRPVFVPVTKPLSYTDQYLHPNWQKMRLFVLTRDAFRCLECGATEKTLHAHHLKYIFGSYIWDVPTYYIVTLCEDCHSKEHGRDLKAKRNS